jgi:predicted enzyme related to lactoylglutathione lyase
MSCARQPFSRKSTVIRKWLIATSIGAACIVATAFRTADVQPTAAAAGAAEPGRFVWRDLMTKDVGRAKQFYGDLLGWRFEDTKRGDRPYVLARAGATPIAGIVDVSGMANAGAQWLSYMAVANLDQTIALVQSSGGMVLVEPRNLPRARAAVIADPEGAPLGLAQLRREVPDPVEAAPNQFFWQEYLTRDVDKALTFYKRLAGYESAILESRLGVDYHVLRTTRGRAGLFRLPPAGDVQPNWLPYILANDPAALAGRVTSLGGRILVPAAAERRNGSLVVIADPDGAALALQKYPF